MTYPDLIQKLLDSEDPRAFIYDVNKNVITVSRSSKRRAAYIKLAINDEDAEKLMRSMANGENASGARAFMILANQELINEIFEKGGS